MCIKTPIRDHESEDGPQGDNYPILMQWTHRQEELEEDSPDWRTSTSMYPPNASREGFMQQGRGGGHPWKDIREVECYTCHKKGHFSRNCSQHAWNQPRSQGWEAIVDDRSEANKTPPPQENLQTHAQHWLQWVAEEEEDVKDLVLQDLLKKEDFPSAWTQQPGWEQYISEIL